MLKNWVLIRKLFLLLGCWGLSQLYGQQPDLTQRYASALSYLNGPLMEERVFNLHIDVHWLPEGSGGWYIHRSAQQKVYQKITAPDWAPTELFDHEALAQALGTFREAVIDAADLPLERLVYVSDSVLQFRVGADAYQLNPLTDELELVSGEQSARRQEPGRSPDGRWVAFAQNHNLYLRDSQTGEERQLSTDGERGYEYASWYGWADIMEGEEAQRPEHFRVNWSPDSEWIQAEICDLRSASKMYLLDWSVDSLYRPRLLSYYRGSPGDTGMVYQLPVFFNVQTGQELRPAIPPPTHINAVRVHWSKEPGRVYLSYASRGYQHQYIQSYDLRTGELKLVYEESSPTNIDNFWYRFDAREEYLYFLSEKSGWRQLYRLHLVSGEEEALTAGDYYIHELSHLDEAGDWLLFMAAGKEQGANPYHRYLYRLSLRQGGGVRLLTPRPGNHEVVIAPSGQYFVDNYSTVDQPGQTLLGSIVDGAVLRTLGKTCLYKLDDWTAPETFIALALDGISPIYGALWRPTHFDSSRQYPVIDASYTGPHTQRYPRSFRAAFQEQALAELGFIVVRIDGRGTAGRSKAFHDYSYKNLGGNLVDHVAAIRHLGVQYTWVDTSRVGIYGHSAGGYDAAHALLAFPDFYKVGVASSADHDHRMEKAWWPEMYMGWPVDAAYQEQSNITMAGRLKGKLLLTHGGIDENVNPSATFKLAEALVQADKPFDMKIFPSQRHGYRGQTSKYFTKLRWNYFVAHLLGEEPIWEITIP